MIFKRGAEVETVDGKVSGRVDRVVINPANGEVTHFVLRKGLILVEDKLVPVSMVARTSQERVTLRVEADALDKLPPFEETHFVPAEEASGSKENDGQAPPPLYWYPPILGFEPPGYMGPLVYGFPGPAFIAETERLIPPGTVPLKVGARVKTRDGEDVGRVEEIITEPGGERITHLVIEHGRISPKRRLIPAHWIRRADETEVELTVPTRILEQLEPYPA